MRDRVKGYNVKGNMKGHFNREGIEVLTGMMTGWDEGMENEE